MYYRCVVILIFSMVLILCEATPTHRSPHKHRDMYSKRLRANGVTGVVEAVAQGARAVVSSGLEILKHIVGVDPPQTIIDVYPYLEKPGARYV